MKTLDVVAAIIERDGKILLAQRPQHADQSGMWEFAGGKVEPGESQPEALVRELREELGIEAVVGRYIASHQREVSGRLIHLHAWHVPSYQGELKVYERLVFTRRGAALSAGACRYPAIRSVYPFTRRQTSGFVLIVLSSRWH